MKRIATPVRPDWQKTVESQGLIYHTIDHIPYWDESAYYEFTAAQVDELERATNELHALCLNAVQHVIDNKLYSKMGIPDIATPMIEYSWNNESPAIYGRFDFSYSGISPPKMLEYNADTPTSLLEASVIQWYWQQDKFKNADQFNSIHERLIAKWKELKDYLKPGELYFGYMDTFEDYMTIAYLADTALQAGLHSKALTMEDIGWDSQDQVFLDKELYSIKNIFKLYAWEWLFKDEYGQNIAKTMESTFWLEPAWKMILSNKAILPILWELNPGHPNLLPAYFDADKLPWHAKKPFYSREGANITLNTEAVEITSTEGSYGEEGYIYQELALLPDFSGNYPVIGSWVIDGESAGIGIREANSLITDNLARFIPHIMK